MSNNTLKNLEQLIDAFQKKDYDLDSYQIAEILWLWQQKQQYSPEIPSDDSPDNKPKFNPSKTEPKNTTAIPQGLPITLPSNNQSSSKDRDKQKPEENRTDIQDTQTESLPISAPDTAFLRNTLLLSRVARPLIQKIDSATQAELNIKKTVKDTAEYSLGNQKENKKNRLTIIPDYKPQKVPSLDAVLIIEEWASMILWKEMATEVRDWLQRLGAFRDVKLYRMGWNDEVKKVEIKPLWSQVQTLFYKDLNHPRGERLMLFFTDCTSPAWYQGNYNQVLKEWGEKQLVTLLSPFPESLWERTALSQGWRVQLQNESPRQSLKEWSVKNIPDLLQIQLELECEEQNKNQQNITLEQYEQYIKEKIKSDYFPLPILSLTPHSLAAWSQVVNGNYQAACAGRLLKISPPTNLPNSGQLEGSDIISPEKDPETAIKLFENTSSYGAWELLKKLSAVPINLSVIRLIQQELIPYSIPSDVAEVLLSSLLKTKKVFDFNIDPNTLEFDFVGKVREILLKKLGKTRAIEVIAKLSNYIAEKIGYSTREFRAILLTNPQNFRQNQGSSFIRAFALISAEVLSQFGPEYQEVAEQLRVSGEQMAGDDLSPTSRKIDWIIFLAEMAKKYNLTNIETQLLTGIFAEENSTNSITQISKDLKISPSAIGRIYRKIEAQHPELFINSPRSKLKTLQQFLQSQYNSSDPPPAKWITYEETIEVVTVKILHEFTSETVFVNKRGETIETRPIEVYYYDEILNEVETREDNNSIRMVYIPEGEFWMGTPDEEIERLSQRFEVDYFTRESPQHLVKVPSFYMSQTPITQAQWRAIASQTALKVNLDLDSDPSRFKGDNLPVEQVSWEEAVEFCQRLFKLTGKAYKLPSEAQWEYACRSQQYQVGNKKQKEAQAEWNENYHQPFHFGETITSDLANYDGSYTFAEEEKGEDRGKTTPVGSFPPNGFGLYDMHGNVWEWCEDEYEDNYENTPRDGSPHRKESMEYIVMRGGSWFFTPQDCRSANRDDYSRDNRNYDVGFRIACVVEKTS